jgi:predicted alpha/beta hydrolase family esterase
MPLADDFQRVLEALPPDWTDLELDLRIDDESQYIDSAVALSQVNAQAYNHPSERHWRLLVAHSFGHAAAAETVEGVLAKLDGDGVTGELAVAEVREGRSEVVQMWGRPESVREEFRQRRSI